MSTNKRLIGTGGAPLGTEGNPAPSALALYDSGITTDGDYYIDVNGTATLLNCKLSSTFATGFYSPNSSKAGWTQFAMRTQGPDYSDTTGQQKVNLTVDAGTVDPSTTTSNWSLGNWKAGFDSDPSNSTETEVMIDIDDTHTIIVNGFTNVATTEANSQIDIVRGFTGSYNVLSGGESSWNNTTATGNTFAGCSSCYRPVYKYKDATYAQMFVRSMTNYHSGYMCSDWCSSGYGRHVTEYVSPVLYRREACYAGGSTSCAYISTVSITNYHGTITRYYFRERPL